MARATRRVFGNPREKGNLGEKYEAEPGRYRPITLHGASLSGHMHAAVQKVNGSRWRSLKGIVLVKSLGRNLKRISERSIGMARIVKFGLARQSLRSIASLAATAQYGLH